VTLRSFMLSAAILGAIIVIFLTIYHHFRRPLIHHVNADLQMIGIISNDHHEVSNEAILNEEDSILVVDHASLLYQQLIQKIPQAKFLSQEELFNVNNLHLFANHSGEMLGPQDAIFKHLFTLKFKKNGEHELKSLPAAGIRGIYLKRNPTGDHEVLQSDGSIRALVSESKLEKTHESPVKE
jgi:hypothetical protein